MRVLWSYPAVFYQLYINYDRKFVQSSSLVETFPLDKLQTFQGLPLFTLFPKTIQGLFQLSEIQRLFKAGLEVTAGAGNLFLSKSLLIVTKNKQNSILV